MKRGGVCPQQTALHRCAAKSVALTEVHVPEPEILGFSEEKAHLARVPKLAWKRIGDGEKSKYYGNWYGNRLAVTICVTTKTLRFSPVKAAICVIAGDVSPGSVPLRG